MCFKVNPSLPKMRCAMFGWNWTRGCGEKDFIFHQYIFAIFVLSIISPLGKEQGPSFEKNNEYPSIKDVLCQVWLKLAHWFWRRSFYNFVNVFPLFLYYLPDEYGEGLHLNKFEFTLSYDALYEVLLKKRDVYLNGDLNSADVELAFI